MVTSGMSSGRSSSASLADSTGAMMTRPATRWSRWRPIASAIGCRSSVRTLSTLTVKPRLTASSASALSVAAGPNSVDDRETTPMTWDVPVTRRRAALFGR